MKKNILAASGLLICGAVLIYSCQKEKTITPAGNPSGHTFALREGAPDPWRSGDMHNNTMTYVLNQVDGVPFASHEDANAAATLHIGNYFAANYAAYEMHQANINGGIMFKDEHINSATFPAINYVALAQDQLAPLQSSGQITPVESQIIMNLFNAIEAARFNGSGAAGVELALQEARQQWESQHFNVDEQEGFLSAAVISVGNGSVAFWQTQVNVMDPPGGPGAEMIPFWVGCDVVGALAGGGSSMYSQRNNASYDWYEIGGQAVIWGASSSLLGSSRFRAFFD